MYTYQKTNRYFGQIATGLEELGSEELLELGGSDLSPAHGGVYFTCSQKDLYQIVYCSRLF